MRRAARGAPAARARTGALTAMHRAGTLAGRGCAQHEHKQDHARPRSEREQHEDRDAHSVKARRAACSMAAGPSCVVPCRSGAALRKSTPGGPETARPARSGGKLRRQATLAARLEGMDATSRAFSPLARFSRMAPVTPGGAASRTLERPVIITHDKDYQLCEKRQVACSRWLPSENWPSEAPPSITIDCPVICAACSPARKAARAAIS